MSTVVYQGLQPCLESSQLLETQILRLTLASPRPCSFFESIARGAPFLVPENDLRDKSQFKEIAHSHIPSNPELGGWSFLQALSNTSQSPKEGLSDKEISSYSHPMAKKSSSTLSNKSLELCTENLGSETGTDISESSIFSLSPLDLQGAENPAREEEPPKSSRQQMEPKRAINKSRNFPPPLTSISSSSFVQIRPHREGGRLIISAVEAPLTHTYLQAERSHGRLRLSFWKDCSSTTTFDSEMVTEEDEDSDSSSSLSSTSSSSAASSSFASFSSSSV